MAALSLAAAAISFSLGLWAGQDVSNEFPGRWLSQAGLEVAGGILVLLIVWLLLAKLGLSDADAASRTPVSGEAGIQAVVENWVMKKPRQEFLREVFSQSDQVEIIGVTLFNTLIGNDWFPEELGRRLKDRGKQTRFLMLDPDGSELKRREAEGQGRVLKERVQQAHERIQEGLEAGGVAKSDYRSHYRLFDHAPMGNWLRFGQMGYLVVLMPRRGGLSPGLELSDEGFLFSECVKQFRSMWDDAGRGADVA